MSIRKTAALAMIAAMAFAACGPSGATTGPTTGPAATGATAPPASAAADCHVGVAWATFQEERYGLRDEPGIKAALEAAGAKYTGNDHPRRTSSANNAG